MAKLVSQVYAEALFGLGVENGLLDTLLEELNGMCEILGKKSPICDTAWTSGAGSEGKNSGL